MFAQQTQVDGRFGKLEERICSLESTVEQRYAEGQLHNLESEIFALERIANAKEATPRDMARLDKLRSELGDVQRALAQMTRTYQCSAPP